MPARGPALRSTTCSLQGYRSVLSLREDHAEIPKGVFVYRGVAQFPPKADPPLAGVATFDVSRESRVNFIIINRAVAQLVARRAGGPEAAGSIPASPTLCFTYIFSKASQMENFIQAVPKRIRK